MKKFKVYNIFTISQSSYIKEKEINNLPSLVDYTVSIPTLQQYIEMYLTTGRVNYVDNGEQLEYVDEDSEFSPADIRDADIEDIKNYTASILEEMNSKKNEENLEFSVKDEERKKEEKKENDDIEKEEK